MLNNGLKIRDKNPLWRFIYRRDFLQCSARIWQQPKNINATQ